MPMLKAHMGQQIGCIWLPRGSLWLPMYPISLLRGCFWVPLGLHIAARRVHVAAHGVHMAAHVAHMAAQRLHLGALGAA